MNRYKILIVDDEEEILQALSRLLRNSAHEIHCAHNAKEAFAQADQFGLDLVLCDYMLDKAMNGVELLQQLVKNRGDVITILMTGYVDIKIAMEAINTLGVYKFILKPWDNDDLLVTIRRALEQRGLILENRRLLDELKKRENLIDRLEQEHPGITHVVRDKDGRIILE
jgi:two-component system, probable response regulator PhcQ